MRLQTMNLPPNLDMRTWNSGMLSTRILTTHSPRSRYHPGGLATGKSVEPKFSTASWLWLTQYHSLFTNRAGSPVLPKIEITHPSKTKSFLDKMCSRACMCMLRELSAWSLSLARLLLSLFPVLWVLQSWRTWWQNWPGTVRAGPVGAEQSQLW